jgi:hypothetical protein
VSRSARAGGAGAAAKPSAIIAAQAVGSTRCAMRFPCSVRFFIGFSFRGFRVIDVVAGGRATATARAPVATPSNSST